ncbi:calcium uptake protein 3, mitochondrial-like isoform X2 [Babylonia areolata]|uniref:calcium uptake protein 3, mitochondrial-like isoform X2 n=1 Tax=Babylonia areolata TaxID=304850 RepID=UPI003FD54BF9
MANRFARRLLQWVQTSVIATSGRRTGSSKRYMCSLLTAATGGGMIYALNVWTKHRQFNILPVAHARNDQTDEKAKSVPYREARFQQFASVEYEGSIYMTPQDFLESIMEETPRPRIGRRQVTTQQLNSWHRDTPRLAKGNSRLFRNLHDKGIISYTEYLFLLCVLTMHADPPKKKGRKSDEPHSGFRIAFNMFDTDGNQIVDKREFLVLENFFILPKQERKFVPRDQRKLEKLLELERVFGKEGQGQGRKGQLFSPQAELDTETPDTTLLIHFFGPKGNQVLNYNDFHKFMSNLQKEVIELEFSEFSRGMSTISEVDFARILLRYTNLDRGQVQDCLHRVRSRIPQETGITLEEFSQFCQFLNNLDDFALSMKMYTFSQNSVSPEDFQRAVKVSTGFTLGPHLVHTVFQIFDSDGDGNLSHQEFISIMKDRLHRGARSHLMHTQNSWDTFRACIRNEMRSL